MTAAIQELCTAVGRAYIIPRRQERRQWSLVVCAYVLLLSSLVGLDCEASASATSWVVINPRESKLDSLVIRDNDFEHPANGALSAKVKMLWAGDFTSLILQTESGKIDYSDYPGEEFVTVLSGRAILTDKQTLKSYHFASGDMFLLPKGWRGTWQVNGTYRELVVLDKGWQMPPAVHAVAADGRPSATVEVINPRASAEGTHETSSCNGSPNFVGKTLPLRKESVALDETLGVHFQEVQDALTCRINARSRATFVRVLRGATTVVSEGGARATFRAGDFFILTDAFRGEWRFGSHYRAVLVTGQPEDAKSQAIAPEGLRDETDPAVIFASRCAPCHGLGVLAPTTAQLAQYTVEEIEAALWRGVMQEPANGLDSGQRVLLAQWIANLSHEKADKAPGVTMCREPRAPWHQSPTQDWSGWSRDNSFERYVPDADLTADRVSHTTLKWALPLPSAAGLPSFGNPVAAVGNRIFFANANHWIYSLDADSGCAEWTFRAEGRVRSNVAIENGVLVVGDLLANVYGLDAQTGRLLWRQRVDENPSARITGNVTLNAGVVYVPVSGMQEVWSMRGDIPCCSFSGSVVALNAQTGSVIWKTPMIDQPLRFLGKTATGINRYGPSGVMVWSGVSVDMKRGVVYVTTANQLTEPAVPESDAVVALDMRSGKKRWVASLAPEEMNGQDIYVMGCESWVDPKRPLCSPLNPKGKGDRDFGAPTAIARLADGSDLLLAGSKDGMFYGLDPDTGKIIWRVRVGIGGELGGIAYGFATDGHYAFVPISDLRAESGNGSLSAIDLTTGKMAWRAEASKDTCTSKPTPCSNAYLSIPAVAGDAVWIGNQDGNLRAFDRDDGRLIWEFDTARDFTGVNGVIGRGGSIANGGPIVVGRHVYVMSGWGNLNLGMPGNTLLAFEIP